MKEIGFAYSSWWGARIYEDEEGFFYEYHEEFPEESRKGSSSHFPSLDALIEATIPKRGVHLILYRGRTHEQAWKDYQKESGTIVYRWLTEEAKERAGIDRN